MHLILGLLLNLIFFSCIPGILANHAFLNWEPLSSLQVQNSSLHQNDSGIEFQDKKPDPFPRIIGGFGVQSTRLNLPWIVALFQNNKPFCTGTLINTQWILTAGHCVATKPGNDCRQPFQKRSSHFHALIGELDLYSRNFHRVVGYHLHDRYTGDKCNKWNYDLAVVKLSSPVQFSPVCLSAGSSYNKGRVSQIGYGSTSRQLGAGMSNYLMGARGNIIPNRECSRLWDYHIGKNKICISALKNKRTGACRGDSGGPLVLYDESFGFIQLGVASYVEMDWRDNCVQGIPNIYASVVSALPWIKSKVGSIKTC